MGTTPTTENKPAKTVNEIIRFAIFEVAGTAIKTALYLEAPWLKTPVINQLFIFILDKLLNRVFVELSIIGVFTVIDLQTAKEKAEYLAAELELRKAHLSGDQNALALAAIRFKETLGRLIHYDGSTPIGVR